MTAAVVVHICEFSSTAMLLLVADREIPENQGLDFPNLWHLDDFSIFFPRQITTFIEVCLAFLFGLQTL